MRRDPAKAIAVLDLLTEFFGEFGHRWIRHMAEDSYGGRCLDSALHHVCAEAHIDGDDTEHYLNRAMPAGYTDLDIFNDDCQSYDEIHAVIVAARALAQAELDAARDRGRTRTAMRPAPTVAARHDRAEEEAL